MQVYTLKDDIETICLTAREFPNGISETFDRLIEKVPGSQTRTFYALCLSDGEGGIIYKAAVQANERGEAERYGCESAVIPKGDYITETVVDWIRDVTQIGKTFRALGDSRPDTGFPCIEWYKGPDVICMVKISE